MLALLEDHAHRPLETALELGSGGGNLASHLTARLRMTLTDASPAMLRVSRSLNPGIEHLEGDMRTSAWSATFDAVIIHDAIVYMTSEADLRAAVDTAFVHLRPGGAAAFMPDWVLDTYRPHTETADRTTANADCATSSGTVASSPTGTPSRPTTSSSPATATR